MSKNTKSLIRNLVFLTTLIVVIAIGGQALGDKDLEISYPDISSSATVPTTTKTLLPSYFLYVFYFALIFSGIVIFGSMLMAGISWMSSMGNPAALKDSKDRMSSAFLGVILLLSSFILLNTINPEITMMKLPGITNKKFIKLGFASGPEVITKSSIPFLSNSSGAGAITLSYDNTNADEVNIVAYNNDNYTGTSQEIIAEGGLPFETKSISIAWKLPGVYLFSNTDYSGDVRLYISNQTNLPDFNDKAKSIKIYNSIPIERLGVVLHEDDAFQGKCAVIYENLTNLNNEDTTRGGIINNNKTSSITVFKPLRTGFASLTGGVTFFNKNGDVLNSTPVQNAKGASTGFTTPPLNNDQKIYGLDVVGNYIVILFKGNDFGDKCEVFTGSDLDLSDNAMGKCASGLCFCIPILNWCPPCVGSCVHSLMVYPLDY